jgi:hypothetical protein
MQIREARERRGAQERGTEERIGGGWINTVFGARAAAGSGNEKRFCKEPEIA